jgi:hypothetical protein
MRSLKTTRAHARLLPTAAVVAALVLGIWASLGTARAQPEYAVTFVNRSDHIIWLAVGQYEHAHCASGYWWVHGWESIHPGYSSTFYTPHSSMLYYGEDREGSGVWNGGAGDVRLAVSVRPGQEFGWCRRAVDPGPPVGDGYQIVQMRLFDLSYSGDYTITRDLYN